MAAVNFGFSELNIETMCGAAEKGNMASNKILKKIGLKFVNEFTYENVPCNWYELKRNDYGKTMS
jgi:ribosomal-protein-alanine N-acetyltransferase